MPYRSCSVVVEYSNLLVSSLYVSEEPLTCATMLEDQGYIIAGDRTGKLRLFQPKHKHKKLTEILGKSTYKASHSSDSSGEKKHKAGVCQIKVFKKTGEVFSVDDLGRVVVSQVVVRRGSPEISAMSYLDLNAEIGFFSVEENSDLLLAGSNSSVYQFSRSINPTIPTTLRLAQNSIGRVTAGCMTSIDVMITGFSDGDVRLFIDIHKDSVLRLPSFTQQAIILVFPGNYSKMDKVSRKVTVMECIASIHALDSSGKLFIFDLEENMNQPEKTLEVIQEKERFSIIASQ